MSGRAENLARVERLRDEGLNGIEIADRTGLSRSYVYSMLSDPDGSQEAARKRQYYGTCVDCGAETAYGVGGPCERCAPCSARHKAKWDADAIVAAIRLWAETYGGPPKSADWDVATLRDRGDTAAVSRYVGGEWPPANTVQRYFESWNAAITAAGFTPRRHHGRGPGSLTEDDVLRTVALVEEHGLHRAAELLDLTPQGVRVRLRKTNRQELAMPSRLSPADVIRREIERLEREIADAEARIEDKRGAITQYERAIEALNGVAAAA